MKSKLLKIFASVIGSIFLVILLMFLTYVYLYYPREARAFEIKPANPAQSILIATQSSEFKNMLVKQLCDSLAESRVHIKGVDVESLSEINEAEWDKILILNTFMIRLNGTVDDFICKSESPGKILVFVTSGGADWQPQPNFTVDAMTSASHMSFIKDEVRLIVDWLVNNDGKKWKPADYVLALRYCPAVDVKKACNHINLNIEKYRATYQNLARRINRAGYQFLRLQKISAALEIFRLNVQLFPEAWNAYDSLAEGYMLAGNSELAISNYQKSLVLNPENKNALQALEQLVGKN